MPARTLGPEALQRIESLAHHHIERGWHSGAQLAIYCDGDLVLDLRLGDAAGDDRRMLWFSATKPLTAVAVLTLVERGVLDLDRPIAHLWPEFAQGGKSACTTRHVLTHQGGFPIHPRDFDLARIDDWQAVTHATAAIEAMWEPGTAVGYHPVTYGFALGELIRRVDGRMPGQFLAEEVFAPLGMDASLGLADPSRLVPLHAMSEVTLEDPEGREGRTSEIVRRFMHPKLLVAQIPAANAIGTGEALARFYAMLEQGGALAGVRLLDPATVAEATRVHVAGMDAVSGLPASFGLGFRVGDVFAPFDRLGVFGHPGQQCTVSYADPARGLAVAYVTNGLQDPLVVQLRTEEMVAAIEEASE